MKISWVIPLRFPTVNDWHGGPPWKYQRIRDRWLREFPPATIHHALKHRTVTLTRVYPVYRGSRKYDQDNLEAGKKPILDALVATGWLKGDTPEWCASSVSQRHPLPGERDAFSFTIVEVRTTEEV